MLQNTLTASLLKVNTHPHKEYPGYDTKQSDGVALVMLYPWGMRRTPLLPSLTGPFRKHLIGSYQWVEQNCLTFKLCVNK